MSSLLNRRVLAAACITLSSCAATEPGATTQQPRQDQVLGAYLAARYAEGQGDPANAAKYYTQALAGDPGNQALAQPGFLAALVAGSPVAGHLAAQVPENGLAVLLQGNQAAQAGDFARAGQIFDQLPETDLAGLIKPLLLAWAEFGQGNTQAALSGLTPYFSAPSLATVYVLNAALIADAGRDDKDAAAFYAAVNGAAPDLRLAQILASWQARQGQNAAAEQELAALLEGHPDLQIALPALQTQIAAPVVATATDGMAEAYLTLAGALNQPSQAFLRLVFLRLALQLRPQLTPARLLLAGTLAGGTAPSPLQLQNALLSLQPVRPSDALYGPVSLQEANLLAALNRPAEAVALLSRLIAANPSDADLLANAGDVLRASNQFAAAMPDYDKAIAAAGKPPPAQAWTLYFDRGICEDSLGDWAKAEPDLHTALALAPNQPYVLNYLGYSWALRGENLAQARAMLQQAVGLDPNDGPVIDSLGYVNLRQGHTKTALALLTQAVELDPDDAEVNAHLGDAFWQAGQKLQADYQFRRALALRPDDRLKAEITSKMQQYFAPPA